MPKLFSVIISVLSSMVMGCAGLAPDDYRDLSLPLGEKQKLISLIESNITLPSGARPIAAYFRSYSFVERRGEKFAYATYQGNVRPGSIDLIDYGKQPNISDGGCDVIVVWYSLAKNSVISAACNGVA